MEGRLQRFNHFNSEFEKQIGSHSTYRAAYEATEAEFNKRVGYNQYSNWDSFKNVRSRKLRRK